MDSSRRRFLRLSAAGAVAWLPMASSPSVFARTAAPTGGQATAQDTRRFLAAAEAGELGVVTDLLRAHPSLLTATDAQGRTAFALAWLNGRAAVGEHLRSAGYLADLHEAALSQDWPRFDALAAEDAARVNGNHPIGGTAMYAAAAGGVGADMWRVYAVDGDPSLVPSAASGASPLQRALRVPDVAIAELTAGALLSNDADPNPASRADDPPLHVAAARGSAVMVEMLVRLGARHDALDREGRSAEEVAVAAGHREVAEMLARHAEIPRTHSTSRSAYDAAGRAYRTPDLTGMSQAMRSGFVGQSHRDLAGITAAAASDSRLVHSVATTGERAVEAGAHMGNKPIVDVLLDHGAPYSLPTAVMRNDVARTRALLDEDPLRINERGAHDFALLWYPVIGQCEPAMMELLLARGADVERQSFLGTTALHWAAQRGRPDLIDMLLDHGAEVNRPGRKFGPDPQTPLAAALRAGQDESARLLRQRGARE